MKKYLFLIAMSCLMILMALFGLWDVYTPRVGPVGNGPNDAVVLKQFIIRIIGAVCFLILGIMGIYKYKKKK